MKQLLNLCANSVYFAFDGKIYVQNDGVVIGWQLGPVLANIIIVDLEQLVIPSLMDKMKYWTRFVCLYSLLCKDRFN